LKLTIDRHEASRGLSATAGLLLVEMWQFYDLQYGSRPPS